MNIAVYPGSFDLATNGHIDIIERAAKIFEKVYVAVIKNPGKNPKFSIQKRVKMLSCAISHLDNVIVESFEGLLVDYAKKKNAHLIIRGLRAVSDFDYEFQMALTNRKMAPDIETIFLMTDYKYSYLSSSFVKQIADLGGDITELAPRAVTSELKKSRRK